jgi:hypothetical protein
MKTVNYRRRRAVGYYWHGTHKTYTNLVEEPGDGRGIKKYKFAWI